MADFDTAKENIQPLASGRNASHLEAALAAETDQENKAKLIEQRKDFECAIHAYQGDDPLQPWYEYVVWVEQMYPKSGKESALHELLTKCLGIFEKDRRYMQDQRMLKLYIKYIDAEADPPQFYEQLYENGIGTMLAELYICWAHYYDYCDNFEKADSVYRKGLDARAQPLDQLQQAHRLFGFSMSQRILHKDEDSRQQFRSTMDEKRMALTSLRSYKHNRVGSIRTGAAIREHNPGRIEQQSRTNQKGNGQIQIFEDANGDGAHGSMYPPSTSVVQSIINSTKQQENRREPGPWNNAKSQTNTIFPTAYTAKAPFSILSDEDIIPLPDSQNMYKIGIQLPATHCRNNMPQNEFVVPPHRDDEPLANSLVKYDKCSCGPWLPTQQHAGLDLKSFSPEEIRAYRLFKKNDLVNNLTKELDPILGAGAQFPIRLPPHFAPSSAPQDKMVLSEFDPWERYPPTNEANKMANDLNAIYPPNDEFSMEELLRVKWINGDMSSQKGSEMDLTCGFERRIEGRQAAINRRSTILNIRHSIVPQPSGNLPDERCESPPSTSRKSVIYNEAKQTTNTAPSTERTSILAGPSRPSILSKRKSTTRVSFLDPVLEVASPPVSRRRNDDINDEKKTILALGNEKEILTDDKLFKIPQVTPALGKSEPVFAETLDDDLENCNTQIFNFYIQSRAISTPKVEKCAPVKREVESGLIQRQLSYDDENDENVDHGAAGEARNFPRQPFACHDIETEQNLTEANELYRHRLSAIMETTEEAGTIASNPSKTSSAEDFDYTKNTNTQTSTLSIAHRSNYQTIVDNTAKVSLSTITSYKEDHSEKSVIGKRMTKSIVYTDNLPKNEECEKTLPASAQFCIYEDEQEEANSLLAQNKTKSMVKESTMKNITVASASVQNNEHDKSEFDLPESDTTEVSQWRANINTPQQKLCKPRPVFQVPNEETGQTITMNFNVERTVPMTPIMNEKVVLDETRYDRRHVNDFPSICAPVAPCLDETKETLPEIARSGAENVNRTNTGNISQVELCKGNADRSVFLLPNENTEKSMFGMPPELTEKSLFMFSKGNTEKSMFGMPPEVTEKSMFGMPLEITEKSTFGMPPELTEKSLFMFSKENTEKSMFRMPPEVTEKSMFGMPPELPEESMFDLRNSVHTLSQVNTKKSLLAQPADNLRESMSRETESVNKSNKTADQSVLKLFAGKTDDSFGLPQPTTMRSMQNDSTRNETVLEPPKSIFSIYRDDTDFMPNRIAPQAKGNESIMSLQENKIPDVSIKSNVKSNETASKSMQAHIDNEFYAMIGGVEKKPLTMTIDDELYKMIRSPNNAKTTSCIGAKSSDTPEGEQKKSSIDDEFYDMIKSPSTSLSTEPKPVPSTKQSLRDVGGSILQISKQLASNDKSQVSCKMQEHTSIPASNMQRETLPGDLSMSLLEPMKDVSIREYGRNDTNDSGKFSRPAFFSDENPHTALFSLNLPSIANSTILMPAASNIEDLDFSLSGPITNIADAGNEFTQLATAPKEIPSVKTTEAAAGNYFSNLDLSIEMESEELALLTGALSIPKAQSFAQPTFQISAPVSMRPSQFNMNETKPSQINDGVELSADSTTKRQSARPSCAYIKSEKDESIMIIDDTINHSSSITRSPFKYHSQAKDINPFDIHVQNALLDDIHFIDYINQLDNVFVATRIRPIEVDSDLILDNKTIQITKQIGQGSFGFVYSGNCTTSNKKYALKQERPANLWEFYISLEIASRVEDKFLLSCFLQIEYALIGHNSSVYLSNLSEYGSLYEICNRHKHNTCRNIDEIVVMILAEQMLLILDHLHAANIIHADIKPDNFLLMRKLSYGRNEMFIKLIDFGRAIDLNFYPANQTFTTMLDTKNFICTEMMEKRPWKHGIDLFCMASTIYTLLCGKYMNVTKQPTSRLRPYALTDHLDPYLEVQLWEQVLYALINVRDSNSLPNLQQIRTDICEVIASKERFVGDKLQKFNSFLGF